MRKYKAILLDLDGTLINIEVSFFIDTMINSMAMYFSDYLEFEEFRTGIFGGIDAIVSMPRQGGETNRDGFNRSFMELTGVDEDLTEKLFTEYYRTVFTEFFDYGSQVDGARKFVVAALRSGYRLALATNPIFPKMAIVERMRWGAIEPELFHVISDLETMRSCKPQTEYFMEVAGKLDVDSEKCLMVGNDVQHDLPASKVGMGTFLVDTNMVHRNNDDIEADGRGTLHDLGVRLGFWSDRK